MESAVDISIVIPLYNEEEIFPELIKRLDSLMLEMTMSIEILLVDDGSTDNTAVLMKQIGLLDTRFSCVFLARNYGHQIALSAGLANAKGTEGVFIIDGDLQDPPELLPQFYNKMKEGYDVVYGVRKKRKEKLLKTSSYYFFYRLQRRIVPFNIPLDSGDFSILNRKVVDILLKMPEESRYIRGLRAWIGFNQIGIEYERDQRKAGITKYSFKRLFKLAYDGIFNFTEFPIKLITTLGFVTILGAGIYLAITLFKRFVLGDVPEGFTGILFTIVLFSGVQLISIGVIGEYIVRIFFQTKGRPLYLVKGRIINKTFYE